MDTQRWSQLRYLFDTAVELPQQLWDDYLRSASSDMELRREAADLLHMDLRLRTRDALAERGSTSAVVMAAHLASTPADPRVGSTIGRWRILRVLGQGSGGIVYLAESAGAREHGHVALKLPHPGATASIRERFHIECDVLRRLRQPGVVRLIEADIETDAEPCLVFEYVDGRDLRRHCDLHGLGRVARAGLFVQVCEIVAQVHASGVAHRDLRTQNILVARDGLVLLDFGRATWLAARDMRDGAASDEPSSDKPSGDDDTREAMIACDVRALARLLADLWRWPGSAADAGSAADESALAAIVARALYPGHATLAGLADELRAALQSGERRGDDRAAPFRCAADAATAPLLHCGLAKSTRQSRRLSGGAEESPGSAGQSAR